MRVRVMERMLVMISREHVGRTLVMISCEHVGDGLAQTDWEESRLCLVEHSI